MRDNMKKVEDDLSHCMKQRDYFRSYYERCCGRIHNSNLPLNLEMINNNHDQDFKNRCVSQTILHTTCVSNINILAFSHSLEI